MASDPKQSGVISIVAALLVPSWWVLPQVLAGLGVLSALSAGCLFWLQKLQPVFFVAALGGLAYQVYLVKQRPAPLRTCAMKTILAMSFAVNALVMGAWVTLWFRYR